jgi:hypothetical protein
MNSERLFLKILNSFKINLNEAGFYFRIFINIIFPAINNY